MSSDESDALTEESSISLVGRIISGESAAPLHREDICPVLQTCSNRAPLILNQSWNFGDQHWNPAKFQAQYNKEERLTTIKAGEKNNDDILAAEFFGLELDLPSLDT